MRSLCLMLLFGTLAQASLIATVDSGYAYPNGLHCTDRYTAPVNDPSFDRSCSVHSPPFATGYSEVAAQGPMHISLASTGGFTVVGCNPAGCPFGDAGIAYNDVWTVTGGVGDGLLVLSIKQTLLGNQHAYLSFAGPGYNSVLILPFVYG